jgi:hypothetical protein
MSIEELKAALTVIANDLGQCGHCGRDAEPPNLVVCAGEEGDGFVVYRCHWRPGNHPYRALAILHELNLHGLQP